MVLTSKVAEHAAAWIGQHCQPKPADSPSLTWYVSANRIYLGYTSGAYQACGEALSFNDFWKVMQLTVPAAKPARLLGQPVFTGIRYFMTPGDQWPIFGV